MKKILLTALVIGITLGILQARIVKEETKTERVPQYAKPQVNCDLAFTKDCADPPISGYRDEEVVYNQKQGFPITKQGVHDFNPLHTDTLNYQVPLITNFFIFAAGIPLLVFFGYKLIVRK